MRPFMRLAAVTAALVTMVAATDAGATSAPKYTMHGPCRVRTTEGPIAFDETYDPELHATITNGKGAEVTVAVDGEGYACVLKGTRKGDVVTLTAGQKCPQKIDRSGVRGDLEGVLASGKATLKGKTIALVTTWNVSGTVKLAFKPVKVAGIVDTNCKGTRP